MWRGHSCLPRRDSSRRSRRSTTGSPMHAEQVRLSPGFVRCRQQLAAARLHLSPNGRKTPPARTSPRCGPTADSLVAPSIPSAIAGVAIRRSSGAAERGHDWRGWRTRPGRSGPTLPHAAEMSRPLAPRAPAPDTLARCAWYRDIDPSKRRLHPKRACRAEDTLHKEGCREDSRSQRAISRPDVGEVNGGEIPACYVSAVSKGQILRRPRRRDESRRGRHECLRHVRSYQ